jgi:hypothetical protein
MVENGKDLCTFGIFLAMLLDHMVHYIISDTSV